MKKIILPALLVGALFAVETTIAHADDIGATSTAKIGLQASEENNDPSDPIVNPDDNDGPSNDPTGNTGSLRIDYVSNVDFGTQTISSTSKTYSAEKPDLSVLAQVTDLRGTGAGWHLLVNYAEGQGFTDGTKKLNGAVLTFPAGEATTTDDNVSATQATTTNAVEVNDSAQTIMDAAANTGLGVWGDKMNPTNVTLDVPAGNLAGTYTATLVWTLTDAPA